MDRNEMERANYIYELEARVRELMGTLKDLRGHLVDGLDDDAYLVLVIDRALAAAEKPNA